MDVLIPIETTAREALYKIYLSKLIALQGVNTYLGTKNHISYLISLFNNYIYVDKGYHQGTSELIYNKIKSKNGIIVNLDEEGAVDFPESSILRSRYSKKLFDISDKVFFWGSNQFKLLKNNIKDPDKISITGHPRFELLKEEYHKIYKKEVDKINSEYGKYILINTNMGFGNNLRGDDFVRNNYSSRFKNIDEIISFDKTKCNAFISLVKKISENYGGNIIFRPHPEENSIIYKTAFKNIDNVQVIYKGSAVEWILGCECMIHPDCSTAIESVIMKKEAISFLPKPFNSKIVTELPIRVSRIFNDEDSLIEYFKRESFYNLKPNNKNINQVLDKYFSISKKSSQIIVDEIIKLFPKKNKFINKIYLKNWLDLTILSFKIKLGRSESHKLVRQKIKGIETNNFRRLNNSINSINPNFDKVKMKKVSDGLFKFFLVE